MKNFLFTILFTLTSLFSFGQTYSLVETDFGTFATPGSKTVVMTELSVTITSLLSCDVLDESFVVVSNLPFTVSPTQDTVILINKPSGDGYLNLTIDVPTNSISDSDIIKFNIYPNPTVDFLNVRVDNYDGDFEVFDLSGKLVIKTSDKSIDVSSLDKGQYLLRVGNTTKMFIKN